MRERKRGRKKERKKDKYVDIKRKEIEGDLRRIDE